MARNKKTRSITLSDEVFNGLQMLALYRKYQGDRSASASSIIEEIASAYLKERARELDAIQNGMSTASKQISLFDFDDDGNFITNGTDSDGNTSADK